MKSELGTCIAGPSSFKDRAQFCCVGEATLAMDKKLCLLLLQAACCRESMVPCTTTLGQVVKTFHSHISEGKQKQTNKNTNKQKKKPTKKKKTFLKPWCSYNTRQGVTCPNTPLVQGPSLYRQALRQEGEVRFTVMRKDKIG